jgi:hypothetical protein
MHNQNAQEQGLEQPNHVSFEQETAYLVVQLDKQAFNLAEGEIIYQGASFQPKDELHITILSREAADKVKARLEQHPQDRDRLERLIAETGWSYRKIDDYYLVQEEPGVETIIQMVAVPGLEPFYQELSRLLGEELEQPPAHVTLYMRGASKGIGLPTQAEFDRLVKAKVDPAELAPAGSA